ncbi:hypothetical protein N658DRAFT_531134 [Parathielavia hyrcaniae]|uniref:Uncharacterized protein n=1 Tax=Parathielavia hyrcaniae TaxID=113614 RepID=A0AAN6Q397_9PEZI|nr:hypothetical protein N658DRAFT_531134 [Parathielavia hyrcaniae]
MPYSDNLYSVLDNESDMEPVDAEDPHILSPTDGYFGTAMGTSPNVPHVPNVMVQDPSLERSTAEGKAREAEQERQGNDQVQGLSGSNHGNTSPAPSHAAGVSHPMSPSSASVAATHHSPSSPSRISPPAYTPSPISPSTNSHEFGSASSNYRTFSQAAGTHAIINMGRPEEAQGLLSHQPESMRDHGFGGIGEDMEAPSWRGLIRRTRSRLGKGKGRVVLATLLLLLVTAGLVTSVLSATREKTGRHSPATDKPPTEPDEPRMSYPEVDGDFSWDTGPFCKDAQIHRHTQTYPVDFGTDKQLMVMEKISDDQGRRGWGEVHTQGTVILRRAGPGTPHSAVTLEVTVTDERLPVYSSWDADSGALQITVPHRVEWSPDRPRACVDVKVTVWVPERATLQSLTVDAVHLAINLLDNLSLSVVDGTKLGSTAGAITSASTGAAHDDSDGNDKLIDAYMYPPASFTFHSRIIQVKTTTAPITGIWPLYDYLGLQSTAGDIDVDISPQPADLSNKQPATLSLQSLSGHVAFREPIHAAAATFRLAQALPAPADRRRAALRAEEVLPPREYRVDVSTTSGDIVGAVAFGSEAAFRSTSGTVSVDLLPVLDSSLAGAGVVVALSTASTSGATDVRVLEPMWADAAAAGLGGGGGLGGGYVALGTRPLSSSSSSASSSASIYGEEGTSDDGPRTPLRCLRTTHTSTSADIKVVLPGSWEGDIGLSSLTGLLQVDGEGVKLIKAGSDWPGVNKQLLARKGEQGRGGRTTGKNTSGSVSVSVGTKE